MTATCNFVPGSSLTLLVGRWLEGHKWQSQGVRIVTIVKVHTTCQVPQFYDVTAGRLQHHNFKDWP